MITRLLGDRPLRSVLYFAGDVPEDVAKSESNGSDAVMLDLEEPRAPFPEPERERARAVVGEFLRSAPPRTDTNAVFLVRVQSIASGQTDRDLDAVMCENLAGVLQPKISGPDDVAALDDLLTTAEDRAGLEPGSRLIYPILETASSLRLAYEIAMASPRVAYMGGALSRFGDIQHALGYRWTPEGRETLFIRSKVLLDAKAAGIHYPISGMWAGRIDDTDGVVAFATELRNIGYYGMLLNSTSAALVPVVHSVFTPSEEEIAVWRTMVEAHDLAEATSTRALVGQAVQGEGHVLHGSQVVSARRNLAWAQQLARRDGRTIGAGVEVQAERSAH